MSNTEISKEEEDDIWEYRSQTKKLKLTQKSQCSSLKSERDFNQKNDSRRRTRISSRRDSSKEIKSLPLHVTSNGWSENESKENKDDFKMSMSYTSMVKLELPVNESCNVKDDPDKKTVKRKTKLRQRKARKSATLTEHATPNHKIRSGRCRVCQFPFMALSQVDTPTWHEEVCLEVPYSSKNQCLSGIHCSNTIESHYKKFRHTTLSRSEHKLNQGRLNPKSGDVQNAKMKLEFDENKSTAFNLPCPSPDDVIDLDDTSPEHTESLPYHHTNDKLSQNNGPAILKKETDQLSQNKDILKRKSDQLKKCSVITLLRQNEIKLSRNTKPPCAPESNVKCESGSKNGVDCLSNYGSSVEIKDATDDIGLSSIERVTNTQGIDDDHEEVLTKVHYVDLIDSGSSNSVGSVEDIDNITDNSRSITEMLKDVFDGDTSELEDSNKHKKGSAVTYTGILQHESSDDDTDILHTSLSITTKSKTCKSFTERQKIKKINNVDKLSEESYTDDQVLSEGIINKESYVKAKDVDTKENSSVVKVTSALTVAESLADTSSCSRDSAKGFFARKLEEKKGHNKKLKIGEKSEPSQMMSKEVVRNIDYSHCELSKDDAPSVLSKISEEDVLGCQKGRLMKTGDSLDESRVESINKNENVKIKPLTRDKHKKKLTLKKKHKLKTSFQKEIERMDMAGLGKITMETDSSDEEESVKIPNHRLNSTYHGCRVPVSINKPELFRKPEQLDTLNNGNPMENLPADNKPDKTQLSDKTNTACSMMDSNQYRCEDIQTSSSEKSQGIPSSTPKFEIVNVRTMQDGIEEELELSEGFFRGETIDMFGDQTEESMDKVNLSECDEDINGVCTLKENSSDVQQLFTAPGEDSDLKCADHNEATAADHTELLENVAVKVQQIQKNALEILMQTSKTLQNRKSSVNRNNPKSVPKSTHSLNDVLMSNRTNNLPTSIPSKPKLTPKPALNNMEESEPATSGTSYNTKKCPFYKKIPGTSLTVDAFKYGDIPDCKAYILSHFHYDHYGGLKKSFCHLLYCTQITGNLVMKKVGVNPQYVYTVALNTPTVVEGVEITFLEANHCPGAALILFKLRTGRVHLHTGDFRACDDMESYPELQNTKIHSLYLDTTYCDPQYDFPSQKEAVCCAIKLAKEAVKNNPNTLIVCGSYTIGKERIFKGIAEALDCKVCVMRDKKSVIDCLEDPWLQTRTSLVWNESQLHVLPMAKLNYMGLKEHLEKNGKKYTAVLGIKPTGWTYNKKLVSLDHIKPEVNRDSIKVYGLPYSEHSSFLEMKRFVQFTKSDKILPTVNNGNYHSRKKMEVIFESWMEEMRNGPTSSHVQPSVSRWTC